MTDFARLKMPTLSTLAFSILTALAFEVQAHGGDSHGPDPIATGSLNSTLGSRGARSNFWFFSFSNTSKWRMARAEHTSEEAESGHHAEESHEEGEEEEGHEESNLAADDHGDFEDELHNPTRAFLFTPSAGYQLTPSWSISASVPVEYGHTINSEKPNEGYSALVDPYTTILHSSKINDLWSMSQSVSLSAPLSEESKEHGKTFGVSASIGATGSISARWTITPFVSGSYAAFKAERPKEEAYAEVISGAAVRFAPRASSVSFGATARYLDSGYGDGARRQFLAAVPVRADYAISGWMISAYPEAKYDINTRQIENAYAVIELSFNGRTTGPIAKKSSHAHEHASHSH